MRTPALLVLLLSACASAPDRIPAHGPPSTTSRAGVGCCGTWCARPISPAGRVEPVGRDQGSAFPDEAQPSRDLQRLLHALNAGDPTVLARFAAERYSQRLLDASGGPESAVLRWLELRSLYGPLRIDTVLVSSGTHLRAWVRGEGTGAWLEFLVSSDSVTPNRIERLGVGRGIRPAHAASRRPPDAERALGRYAAAYMDQLARQDYFSGAVLVAKGTAIVHQGAYGCMDRESHLSNRLDTRFNLASVGKLFTAVAIGQLADQGRIALDDPLARHLPQTRIRFAREITLRQLLEHSSGLGEAGPEVDSAIARAGSATEMAMLFTDSVPAFAPGSDFRYSNRGYILLGAVVEAVAGRDYFRYVGEEIFRRAGMRSSGFFATDERVPRRARMYTFYPEPRGPFAPGPRRLTLVQDLGRRGSPAGGAYSTVADLLRFAQALEKGELLRPATLAELTSRAEGRPWGLGFEVSGEGMTRSYGHRGGAAGVSARLEIYPELGYTLIALANYDTAANIAVDYIRDLILPR